MKTNYKEIFTQLIFEKFPEKLHDPKIEWKLEHLDSALNILDLNQLLFPSVDKKSDLINSRLKSYTKNEIIRILKYQAKYNKGNTEIVEKFGISRTTLITWKKRFQNQFFDLVV
jgi:hypothetical protein